LGRLRDDQYQKSIEAFYSILIIFFGSDLMSHSNHAIQITQNQLFKKYNKDKLAQLRHFSPTKV
jgi:hypothetical protein